MITGAEVTRLLQRPPSGRPVLSLFLDMSMGADNHRTHEVHLAQLRARAGELARSWSGIGAADVEDALDRARAWLEESFDPASRGVALFLELGGAEVESISLPVPLPHRALIDRLPAVAPLVRALQNRRRHALVLVDRAHLRLLEVWLGRVLREEEVRVEPYPTAHDVQAGGFAEQRYQRRKLQEERHSFGEFAEAVEAFVQRTGADEVTLLGTDQNVARLRRALPLRIAARVTRTDSVPADAPAAEVLERVAAALDAYDAGGEELLATLRQRAAAGYRAAAGVRPTLQALQAGRVEAVVLADEPEARGWRCPTCGSLFSEEAAACPYDGSPLREGVPLVEEALRLAVAQHAEARLVTPEEAGDFAGAGALLRF